MNLANKKVFILGGSSEIGKAIIEQLNSDGAEVFASFNSGEIPLLEQSQQIKIDLNDLESLGLVSDFFETHCFDAFINCAGINIAGPLIGLEDSEILSQFNVNLIGPSIITQKILKRMIRAKKGSIVHLSSVSSQRFARGHAIYSAAKAGIEGLVKATAAEVAKRKIRVNAILPGPVMSPMLEKSIEETGLNPKDRVPMNRLINKEEICQAVKFLISDESQAITGTTIPVDGGYVLW